MYGRKSARRPTVYAIALGSRSTRDDLDVLQHEHVAAYLSIADDSLEDTGVVVYLISAGFKPFLMELASFYGP